MLTLRMAMVAGLVALAACSGKTGGSSTVSQSGTSSDETPRGMLPPDTVNPGGTGPHYPGTGFRVHEWGTNTIVVGSDGSMQRGLQHEEEDLPSFVYDRRREELASPADVKMETPVTYFYLDVPLTATVGVTFPRGVLTQWYPAVSSFQPPFFKGKGDPALDPKFAYSTPVCREQYSHVANGSLQWGSVEILPRSENAVDVSSRRTGRGRTKPSMPRVQSSPRMSPWSPSASLARRSLGSSTTSALSRSTVGASLRRSRRSSALSGSNARSAIAQAFAYAS